MIRVSKQDPQHNQQCHVKHLCWWSTSKTTQNTTELCFTCFLVWTLTCSVYSTREQITKHRRQPGIRLCIQTKRSASVSFWRANNQRGEDGGGGGAAPAAASPSIVSCVVLRLQIKTRPLRLVKLTFSKFRGCRVCGDSEKRLVL